MKEFENFKDLSPVCGVYALFQAGEVVYIGRSKDVHKRIGNHKGKKVFDKVMFIEVPEYDLAKVEREMIEMHIPILNKAIPSSVEKRPEWATVAYFNDMLFKGGHGGGCECLFCEGDSDIDRSIWIEQDAECWKWTGSDGGGLGFHASDLIYGFKGLFGRGVEITKCLRNEWCINPWHRRSIYVDVKDMPTCRWGHALDEHGRCKECERIRKSKWRSKVQLKKEAKKNERSKQC